MLLFFIFDLHFVVVSSFVDVLHFVVVLHSHFLFDVIPHRSMDYRRIFTPTLYYQPSPSQRDMRHFHFSTIPLYLLAASATALSGHFVSTNGSYLICSFTDILPAFIKASLGAGSSSLKFTGLHTDPRNTDPPHLFV